MGGAASSEYSNKLAYLTWSWSRVQNFIAKYAEADCDFGITSGL